VTDERWAWAEIDVDAVRHNVETMRRRVAPSGLWAVVKADGYGHGAIDVARAALAGGADGLCVALVAEGVELRDAGIEAPILVLSEQPDVAGLVRSGLSATVYTERHLAALDAAATAAGATVGVHVKVDTGMQRVGVAPVAAPALVDVVRRSPGIRWEGICTHLAIADVPDDPFTEVQLARFDDVLTSVLGDADGDVAVHAANSAGALAHPRARRSLVRVGIGLYGISPGADLDGLCGDLRPAMTLCARVAFVKRVEAGSRISYGLRHEFERATVVATVPIGYADGVPRRLGSTGAEVLVGGRRRPIVGAVTMDQLMVDCGPAGDVAVGDTVVLIGTQGEERIRAEEWADRLGTIGYEIVCGVGARVPRRRRAAPPNID
jgi:alanine racemase